MRLKKAIQFLLSRLMITIYIVLIQVVWIVSILLKLQKYYIFSTVILGILSFIIVIYIVNKRDNPAYKLSWSILILGIPLFGVIMFGLFGRKKLTRKLRLKFEQIHEEILPLLPQDEKVLEHVCAVDLGLRNQCSYLYSYAGYPIYENTKVEFFPTGEENFEVLKQELKKAKHFIFMEYFIIEEGEMFNSILSILEEKVKEGVMVRFIYDDMGSVSKVPLHYERRMRALGIDSRVFNPVVPFLSVVMNHRDHRKITVIDGHTGFTGGYNLADEYINLKHPFGYWKDTGAKIEGEAVWNLTCMFLEMWNGILKTDTDFLQFKYQGDWKHIDSEGFVQPYSDSPLDNECVGENVYLNIIRNATKYIYIYTPYLITDNEMIEMLSLAAKSGVDVRIVTPHIPDKKIIFLLTRSYYAQLMDAGVKIYEYEAGFIHAKEFISDDQVATIGTINCDFRSLYLHFECGTLLANCDAVWKMKEDFLLTVEQSIEMTKEMVRPKNFAVEICRSLLRLFAPLL